MQKTKSFTLIFIVCSFFLIYSCAPDTTCKLSLKATNKNSVPLTGANVSVFASIKTGTNAPISADVKRSGVTGSSGSIDFTFDNEAIFDVNVTYQGVVNGVVTTYTAAVAVKLEVGKTVSKTITLPF